MAQRTPRLKVALGEGTRAEVFMVSDLLKVPMSTAAAILVECGLTVKVEDLFEAKARIVGEESSGAIKKKRA